MIAHCGDRFVLVVNASKKAIDEQSLRAALAQVCAVEGLEDRALLALQGPDAESVLARFAPDSAAMRFMDARSLMIGGSACVVTRSGYTGEDGFEISVAASEAETLARVLLQNASSISTRLAISSVTGLPTTTPRGRTHRSATKRRRLTPVHSPRRRA